VFTSAESFLYMRVVDPFIDLCCFPSFVFSKVVLFVFCIQNEFQKCFFGAGGGIGSASFFEWACEGG